MSDDLGRGMDVDLVTGRPREKAQRQQEIEKNLEVSVSAGLETERRLKSKEGKQFIQFVELEVQRRIEELVNQDPEALALLRLLDKFGFDIQVGRAAALRLTRLRLGRESNTPL